MILKDKLNTLGLTKMKKPLCKLYILVYIYVFIRCILIFFFFLCRNFWDIMKAMEPKTQRKLLMFVTGSDRIPATGATQMQLKITCGNNGDSDR
jgi:hypothetical protein